MARPDRETSSGSSGAACIRCHVEEFLAREAWLLDNWQLDEWLQLLTPDFRYVVPATDFRDGDPDNSVVFINDDLDTVHGRVRRLQSRFAHREYPTSRTRRFLTNILVDASDDQCLLVTASFQVYRFRARQAATYVGWYEMELIPDGQTFKIRRRKATLDQEILDEHGAISILL